MTGFWPRQLAFSRENQKQDWPAEHSSVPLPQWQLYGSISPVGGNLPRTRQTLSAFLRSAARFQRGILSGIGGARLCIFHPQPPEWAPHHPQPESTGASLSPQETATHSPHASALKRACPAALSTLDCPSLTVALSGTSAGGGDGEGEQDSDLAGLPWLQASRSASTELRDGGMIMDPCAFAPAARSPQRAAVRIISEAS